MCKRDTHLRRSLGCHTPQVCCIDILYCAKLGRQPEIDSPQLEEGINTYHLTLPSHPHPSEHFIYLNRSAIGTLIRNHNVDVQDIKNGNWKWMFSVFRSSDSTNSHSGR